MSYGQRGNGGNGFKRKRATYVVPQSPGCPGWAWQSRWKTYCRVCYEEFPQWHDSGDGAGRDNHSQGNSRTANQNSKGKQNGAQNVKGEAHTDKENSELKSLAEVLLPLLSSIPIDACPPVISEAISKLQKANQPPRVPPPSIGSLRHQARSERDKLERLKTKAFNINSDINSMQENC